MKREEKKKQINPECRLDDVSSRTCLKFKERTNPAELVF